METSLVRIAAVLAVPLLALGACSHDSSGGSSDRSASSSGSSGDRGASPQDARQVADAGGKAASEGAAPSVEQPAIISTGSVTLEATDVAKARSAVQQVAAAYGGQVTDQETSTAEDKRMGHARLVLRVPARSFAQAMDDLEHVADLVDSTTSSEDVSTQVIDVDERVKAARASIDRITTLLSRAEKIGDVMAIEAQLSQREADLNSLLRQQAHLADQTALSTISVSIDRPVAGHAKRAQHRTGFVAGLSAGWDALRSVGTGVATVGGALLPWLPVALLIGLPVWLVVRRGRRRTAEA